MEGKERTKIRRDTKIEQRPVGPSASSASGGMQRRYRTDRRLVRARRWLSPSSRCQGSGAPENNVGLGARMLLKESLPVFLLSIIRSNFPSFITLRASVGPSGWQVHAVATENNRSGSYSAGQEK